MSMDIRDAEDSWMAGKRAWETFIRDFEARWYAPKLMEDLVMGLAQLPEEIRSQLPQDAFKRLTGGMYATQRKNDWTPRRSQAADSELEETPADGRREESGFLQGPGQ